MADGQAKSVPALSPRDTEILMAALQCLKGGALEVNYAELAPMIGAKNANSANTSWLAVKKKLFPNGQTPATPKAAGGTTSKAPKTPAKSKATDAKKPPKSSTKKQVKSDVMADAPSTPEAAVSADDAPVVSQPATPLTNGDRAMHETSVANGNEADADVNVEETPLASEGPTLDVATPKTPSPAVKTPTSNTGKKRGRKSKAEKEAEAAAAATAEGDNVDGEDEVDEKPAKKRKTPAKPNGNNAASVLPSIEPGTPPAEGTTADPATPGSATAADTTTTPTKKAAKPRAPRKPKDPNAPPSARSKAGKALKAAREAAEKDAAEVMEKGSDKADGEDAETINAGHPSAAEEMNAVLAAKNAVELGKKDDAETASTKVNDADMNAAIAATLDEADKTSEVCTNAGSKVSKTKQTATATGNGVQKKEQGKGKVTGAGTAAAATKDNGKAKAPTPTSEITVEIPATVKDVATAVEEDEA